MKQKILIIISTAIITLGVVTAAYAADNINPNFWSNKTSMMSQSNVDSTNYKNMINLMKNNGFEAAANAMENKDYNAMNDFMKNMTDDQYNKMINIMKSTGYNNMAQMIQSTSRESMVNMHNSMMGK